MIIILPFIPGVINYIYISPCVMDFGTKNSCNAFDQNNALGMKMLSLSKMSKYGRKNLGIYQVVDVNSYCKIMENFPIQRKYTPMTI